MSSINFNSAAQTALTTLKLTNQDLDKSSNRVATGQKVATASDNAAYWSIATSIRADNGSLGAVKDAIGLGLATVNAAVQGLETVKNTFLEIKNRLIAAENPNVDRNKLQTEIDSRQNDLRTVATSAATNGEAWLAVDSGSGNYAADRKIVASFSRVQGQIAVGTVTINVDQTKLYDATTTAGATGTGATDAGSTGGIVGTWKQAQTDYGAATDVWNASDKGTSAQNTYKTATTTYNTAKATFDAAVVSQNKAAATGGTSTAGQNGTGGILNKEYAVFGADENGLYKSYSLSVDKIDIKALQNTDLSKLRAYVNLADKVLSDITTVATKLGAVQSQIQTQSNFVDALMKNNDKSVSILTDADMEEESTKLKALQVQQQLGVQSLSIANQSTQNILSLFRQ